MIQLVGSKKKKNIPQCLTCSFGELLYKPNTHIFFSLHNTSSSYTPTQSHTTSTDTALSPPAMAPCLFVLLLHSCILSLLFVVVLVFDCLFLPLPPIIHQFIPPLFCLSSWRPWFYPPPWYNYVSDLCLPAPPITPLFFVPSFNLILLPLPLAFGRKLQSQLFFLELRQAHHDGVLVYAGLSFAGHQSHTHQLLLHTPHQLCRSHGARGGQGRCWFCRACQRGARIKGSDVHHLISNCWQSRSTDLKNRGGRKAKKGTTTSGKWIITLQTLRCLVVRHQWGKFTTDSSRRMMTLGWINLH